MNGINGNNGNNGIKGINVNGREWTMKRFRERCQREAIRMIWMCDHNPACQDAIDAIPWLQSCELSFRTTVNRKDYYDSIKCVIGLTEVFPELRNEGAIGEFLDTMKRVWENDELAGILN